jgi:hypothetical protein
MSAINRTIKQLQAQRASLDKEIAKLDAAIKVLQSLSPKAAPAKAPVKKRKISKAGIARIRAAQKARWAKIKAQKQPKSS